ncbi:ATP-dependent DNA helicase RecG [Thermoflavifilum thermophilum]|uniref:ATP-dependent DNA helicase RecG n=1 Tax=Thermoflavifilum thermophilum TaxID=1393122 RepID=A0A1I7NEU9_9BACT|nr:ATP-dependent DNA helicase RecG [Thermoflavifilum thermophilum]SFV33113.1 ATP-dependent DNA helicase RecG [Thermoflavifilum thermophilum]
MPAYATSIWSIPVEYIKGVGPQRAELLKKELRIFTGRDLLMLFPYRYYDRSEITPIARLTADQEYVQVKGLITQIHQTEGTRWSSTARLVAELHDDTGFVQLIWFNGWQWVKKSLLTGKTYLVFGRLSFFNGIPQIVHPELSDPHQAQAGWAFEPVYPSTEKLRARGLNSRGMARIMAAFWEKIRENDIPENIPVSVRETYQLMDRGKAFRAIHFPGSWQEAEVARRRLKFEELFLSQVRIAMLRNTHHHESKGWVFQQVGELFNSLYNRLPFSLTEAQKRVIREIRRDTLSGHQMNRLLQGDVGSGKTIVALLVMLLAVDNGFQACLMAPTEILAQQHYRHITELLEGLPVEVALLTGNVRGQQRKQILEGITSGSIQLLIGTHALIEDTVQFARLGLAVIDEQHRFGVAQRAALWEKSEIPPHVLVMTATPIPRTLAMTVYGDLDVSVIDQLPPGRKKIITVHRTSDRRHQVMDFVKSQIRQGRQAYIVYPLIEESEKLDYENLMRGYEEVKAYFPEPDFRISMVHGQQSPEVRNTNMQRFVQGITHIMVATTVIEVGVHVPNATIMVIESAEKFGLSQLHQLRGRVGRGEHASYCILLTAPEIGKEAMERIRVMTQTDNGFLIAEKDLQLRGPGDIEGTRQSGVMEFKLADVVKDNDLLMQAREAALRLVEQDPLLMQPENQCLLNWLQQDHKKNNWSKIS